MALCSSAVITFAFVEADDDSRCREFSLSSGEIVTSSSDASSSSTPFAADTTSCWVRGGLLPASYCCCGCLVSAAFRASSNDEDTPKLSGLDGSGSSAPSP